MWRVPCSRDRLLVRPSIHLHPPILVHVQDHTLILANFIPKAFGVLPGRLAPSFPAISSCVKLWAVGCSVTWSSSILHLPEMLWTLVLKNGPSPILFLSGVYRCNSIFILSYFNKKRRQMQTLSHRMKQESPWELAEDKRLHCTCVSAAPSMCSYWGPCVMRWDT